MIERPGLFQSSITGKVLSGLLKRNQAQHEVVHAFFTNRDTNNKKANVILKDDLDQQR